MKCSFLVGLLLVEQCISAGLSHKSKDGGGKKDMSIAETRVDPYLYSSGANIIPLDGHIGPIGPIGLEGGALGHIGGLPVGAGYGPGLFFFSLTKLR